MTFPKSKKKSGDSKLQDAAAAREKERIGEGPNERDPGEMREDLVNELQDSAEQAKAAGASKEIVDQKDTLILRLTEALSAMEKRIASLETTPTLTGQIQRRRKLMICPTCGQQIYSAADKRGVCTGEHIPVMVAPTEMDLWPSFQGVRLNGAKYAGRSMLPPSIVNTVMGEVKRWAVKERRKFIPGGKIFGMDGRYTTGSVGMGQTPIL